MRDERGFPSERPVVVVWEVNTVTHAYTLRAVLDDEPEYVKHSLKWLESELETRKRLQPNLTVQIETEKRNMNHIYGGEMFHHVPKGWFPPSIFKEKDGD